MTSLTLAGPANDHTLSQLPTQFPGLVTLQLLGSYYASDWGLKRLCRYGRLAGTYCWAHIDKFVGVALQFCSRGTSSLALHLSARFPMVCSDILLMQAALALLTSNKVLVWRDSFPMLLCNSCRAPHLECLLLEGCEHVTEYGLEAILRGGSIKVLAVHGCGGVDER